MVPRIISVSKGSRYCQVLSRGPERARQKPASDAMCVYTVHHSYSPHTDLHRHTQTYTQIATQKGSGEKLLLVGIVRSISEFSEGAKMLSNIANTMSALYPCNSRECLNIAASKLDAIIYM